MKKKLNALSCLLYLSVTTLWCPTDTPQGTKRRRSPIFAAVDASEAEITTNESSLQAPESPLDEQDDTVAALKNLKKKRRLTEILHESRTLTEGETPSVALSLPYPEQMEASQAHATISTAPESNNEEKEEANIEFYFEDADFSNLLGQISDVYNVSFISDDNLDPIAPGGRALKGNKITFKTHRPMNKREAWNLFLKFLDLAGYALVPEPEPGIYRIVTADKAQKMAVPTYIGIDASKLPDNDQVIRYVYFIENASVDSIKEIVTTLKSPNANLAMLQESKAFVLTDKAYTIKTLMEVVHEIDHIAMPQAMSVIKLKRTDALDVKKLYDDITKSDNPDAQNPRIITPKKSSPTLYFSENVRIIPEVRTNSLIVFGSIDGIKKVEDFIANIVDVDLEKPYSPFHHYEVKHASATTLADIMNTITKYGAGTPAGAAGGVRGGDKFLKPLSFYAESSTNVVVVKGEYEDYLKALEIMQQLDAPQPQVAIEALIITIDWTTTKQLGTQIRNKVPNGPFGKNMSFQTSGNYLPGTASSIITREGDDVPGSERLLGNLVTLAVQAGAGNTVVSLGSDDFGVWGIFSVLESLTSAQVISNPFTVTTNKTAAKVSVGEVRRVVSSTIFSGNDNAQALDDMSATLDLKVTPQINADGMIILDIDVKTQDFLTAPTDIQSPALATRQVTTKTIMADREVIAIGGIVQNRFSDAVSKVPVLGDIPILGWLFKNKNKVIEKNNLLILISTRIIAPDLVDIVDDYTENKLVDYYDTHKAADVVNNWRDPVDKSLFNARKSDSSDIVENFLIERSKRERTRKERNPLAQNYANAKEIAQRYGEKYRQQHMDSTPLIREEEKGTPYTPSSMLQYLTREGDNTIKLSNNQVDTCKNRDARRRMRPMSNRNRRGVMA